MPTAKPIPGNCRCTSILLVAGLMAALMMGCQNSPQAGSKTKNSDNTLSTRPDEALLDALDREYAIGPRAARGLGYRLGWQVPDAGTDTVDISPQSDSVFIRSNTNILERLTADTGTRLWSSSIGSPVAEVLGLTYMPDSQMIYITRDSSILSIRSGTGVMTSSPVQSLRWIANTEPVLYDNYLIYGSRAGELVWQAYEIGHSYRAYKIGQVIDIKPVLQGNTVVAIANTGEIVAINTDTVSKVWGHKLLDRVVAAPAIGPTAAYVASQDQYLRAFDLFTGRVLWKSMTEAPLDQSPIVDGRHVYQHVPGVGLTCYEAMPQNRFDGRRLWVSPDVSGNVITTRGDRLITWNDETSQLSVISKKTGTLEKTMRLNDVRLLIADNLNEGRLYTLDNRGRLDCLIPLN